MHPDYREVKSLQLKKLNNSEIARQLGMSVSGVWQIVHSRAPIPGTTRYGMNQARVFFRFPINSHKPGP